MGLSRISKRSREEDIPEGDSCYLAQELLNDSSTELPDLTKADIFSLGMSLYELMIGEELPQCGDEWINIRKGMLPKLSNT